MNFYSLIVGALILAAVAANASSTNAVNPDGARFASASFETVVSLKRPGFESLSIDGLALGKRGSDVLRPDTTESADFDVHAMSTVNSRTFEYRRRRAGAAAAPACWTIELSASEIRLVSEWSEPGSPEPLTLTFNPSACHATLLGLLNPAGAVVLPALLHLPGEGSLRIAAIGTTDATLDYHPAARRGDLMVAFPAATHLRPHVEYQLDVTAIYPDVPGIEGDRRFDSFRSNWLNVLQLNPVRRQLSNNSASTSCVFCYYEYADIAAKTPPLADGLTALDLVRQTLDTILAGAKAYGLSGAGNVPTSDSLPSLLIAADDCVRGGNNDEWLASNYTGIKAWADKMLATDTNGDGLIKYIVSGNSGIWSKGRAPKVHPANWWDTIGFGHEDAYANALAYRALGCMAGMSDQLDNLEDATRYRLAADKLRAAYFKTFYDPATNVIGGWRSADGQLHDYYFLWVNGIAIDYGLVPKDKTSAIMDKLMAKMKEVGYTQFHMGLPGNLISVPLKDYVHDVQNWHNGAGVREDNSDGFQRYENGGATGCFAYFTLAALYDLGRRTEADAILFPMLQEYERGGFEGRGPNGRSNDWRMWDGTPMGYEGFLSDNYYSLLAVLLRQGHLGPPQ